MTTTDAQERLTSGWEPETPLSDSLGHRFNHAYAASFAGPVAEYSG